MTDIYDRWADDTTQVDPGNLTMRLTELRDNIEPELPAKGTARHRRIERMQRDLNEIMGFVEDCDRWAEQTRDVQLVGRDVRIQMTSHLTRLRAKAVERGRQIHDELQYLRRVTP